MWPYPWTHVGTPSHLGHMDRVAATMPSQAHAGAAQEAPDIGQWEGQEVPLVRPSSCNVKGGIPSSRRYLPTCLLRTKEQGAEGGPAATANVHVCCRHHSTEQNQQGVIYNCCSLESSIPLRSASSAALFFASAASRFFLSASSAFRFSASCGPSSRVQVEVRLQLPMCMCVVGTIPQNTINKE